MLCRIILIFLLVVSATCQSQDAFPGIEQLMTQEEFEAAGLAALSQEQLEQLNKWLIRYTARDAEVMATSNKEVRKEADKEYRSRIVGRFEGWDGDTRFILENGEIWEQRQSGKWRTRMDNPEVLIYKNALGFYNLRIIEANRVVGIRRIK